MPQCFCPAVPPVAWSFPVSVCAVPPSRRHFSVFPLLSLLPDGPARCYAAPRPHISGPSPGLFPAPAPFSAGWIRADSVPLFFQLLSGFFPGILHRLKQEAFFLRKRFPQYILSTNVVASQGRCLQVVILNKGILSGSVSLFCLPQCLLISAYLALYPAGL